MSRSRTRAYNVEKPARRPTYRRKLALLGLDTHERSILGRIVFNINSRKTVFYRKKNLDNYIEKNTYEKRQKIICNLSTIEVDFQPFHGSLSSPSTNIFVCIIYFSLANRTGHHDVRFTRIHELKTDRGLSDNGVLKNTAYGCQKTLST